MENRITISMLAAAMAEATGRGKKSCEDFVKEFFRLTADVLAAGENIRIKGFGSFKIAEVEARSSVNVSNGEPTEILAHKKVIFTPSKEMASLINAPFEVFESVELDDDIDFYEIDVPEEVEAPSEALKEGEENLVETPVLEAGSDEEEFDDEITYEAYNEETEQPASEIPQPEEQSPEIEKTGPEPEVIYVETPNRFGKGFFMGALSALVVCLAVFMIGCFLNWWPVNFGSSKALVSEAEKIETLAEPVEAAPSEEIEAVNEEPAVNPVYDTVTTTRYLTTISREHYGNFNFWPYIYIENESILGHPDRITPGTKVIVPPLSKYGVDPANKADEEAAKKKALEIYSKFR